MMTYLSIKGLYFLHKLRFALYAGYQHKISGMSVQSLSGFFKQVPKENKRLVGLSPAHLRFSTIDVRPARELFIESLLSKI